MHVQAGAGVVHDSVPENEQQECINKARALFRAAEEAVRFAGRSNEGRVRRQRRRIRLSRRVIWTGRAQGLGLRASC